MELTELEFEVVDWIHLARYRNLWRDLINTVENSCFIKGRVFLHRLRYYQLLKDSSSWS